MANLFRLYLGCRSLWNGECAHQLGRKNDVTFDEILRAPLCEGYPVDLENIIVP